MNFVAFHSFSLSIHHLPLFCFHSLSLAFFLVSNHYLTMRYCATEDTTTHIGKDKWLPVWVKGQTSSVPFLFLFSRLLPGKSHVFVVPTREMWLLTWAQVWQGCTDGDDSWPLTYEIKAGHGVLHRTLLHMTSHPDRWGRERGGNKERMCGKEMCCLCGSEWMSIFLRC